MKTLWSVVGMFILGLTGSLLQAQTNVSGLVSTNTTWALAHSPYIVTGNVLVQSGVTLTLEPGVVVKFDSALSMQIDGTLLARGTSDNNITFTSHTVDTAGAWGYIYFGDGSTDAVFENDMYGNYLSGSILQYCRIQYAGGANVTENGAVRLDNAHPFIDHCIIANNSASGIRGYNLSASLKITNCAISENTTVDYGGGVHISGTGTTLVSGNTITGNSALSDGGGICNMYWTAIIVNNIVTDNTTGGNGGGIASGLGGVSSSPITNNIIMRNVAADDGGGLYVYNGTSAVSGNVIANNTANRVGGFFAYGGSDASISNNVISDNSALGIVGGVWSLSSQSILNNQIIRNSATDDAGVLTDYNGTIRLNTIAWNTNTGYDNPLNRAICVDTHSLLDSNNILSNAAFYELYNGNAQGSGDVDATNNWWGTSNDAGVQTKIYDWFDNGSQAVLNYSPYLTTPDTAAPVSPPAHVRKTNIGAGQTKISWTHNPEPDIAGYHVYYGKPTGYGFAHVVDAGNDTSCILAGVPITDTIAVTVYDRSYRLANELESTIVNDNMINGNESWYSYAVDTAATSGVSFQGNPIPKTSALLQNYPNPFNPSSEIGYQISEFRHVTLVVYDLLGREVAVLVNEPKSPGSYEVKFDGSNLPSGVYFYRLQTGNFMQTKRLLLLK